MVNDYPFDRPKKVIYNEKKRITKLLSPHSEFVVRDPSVIVSTYIYITYILLYIPKNLAQD